jgi:hypothetical protein
MVLADIRTLIGTMALAMDPRRAPPRVRFRRFAKVARDYRTGLKSMISGPIFIGSLVGVVCRMMVLGPGLGTLAGTLEPKPVCAYQAHIVLR